MKNWFVMTMMFVGAAPAFAAVEGSPALQETARTQLWSVLGKEWKEAKSEARCGTTKLARERFKYSCIFKLNNGSQGAAFAVLFDEGMQLVAIVRGEGKLVGKKMEFGFGIKDGIGFTEHKEISLKGTEVGK